MTLMDNNYPKILSFQETDEKKGKHQFENLSRKIIGAALEVHRELGPGFLENVYEEALKVDLDEHGLIYNFTFFRVFVLSCFRDFSILGTLDTLGTLGSLAHITDQEGC